jgi:serine/threonine-protein kinase
MSKPLASDDRRAQQADMVGQTIAGKFVVEGVVGTGAMGVVYRARQTSLDKVVAIKVMHPMLLSDPSFAARFHREARAASRLDHPNSIRILDFGEEPDGRLFIAMDYLDGRDLLEVINEEWPLSTARTVNILAQTLSALAVAHDLGILHRDLKPENIMVLRGVSDEGAPQDIIRVCDFGIAKITEKPDAPEGGAGAEQAKLSTGGMVFGTPAYMSPEQARGDPLDARSDVYAVGVILYQMLTMRVPFDGPTPLSTLLRLVNEEAMPPSVVNANVDPALEGVCLKAMAKKPENRYATAREMRSALRGIEGADLRSSESSGSIALRASGSATTEAASATAIAAGPSPKRARPRTWASIGLGLVALAAVVILLSRMRRPKATSEATALVENAAARAADPSEPAPDQGGAVTAAPSAPLPATVEPAMSAKPRAPSSPRAVEVPRAVGAEPSSMPTKSAATPSAATASAATASTTSPPAHVAAEVPPSAGVPAAPRPADPAAARVEIGTATHLIGTTGANVGKVMAGVAAKLDACYRTAIAQGAAAEGPGNLHLETNEDGVVTEARLDARLGAPLGSCIGSAVRGRRIANVDTGRASADVPLGFRLR